MWIRIISYCLLGPALMFFVGCDTVTGTEPYALWETYDDSDGRFHFHYLNPPWKSLSDATSSLQVFAVEPNDDGTVDLSCMKGASRCARYVMEVEAFSVSNAERIAQDDIKEWKEEGAEVESLDPFMSRGGDEGVWTGARGDDWRVISVYFNLEIDSFKFGAVAMRIAGDRDMGNMSDIMLLLKGLEPRPSTGNDGDE